MFKLGQKQVACELIALSCVDFALQSSARLILARKLATSINGTSFVQVALFVLQMLAKLPAHSRTKQDNESRDKQNCARQDAAVLSRVALPSNLPQSCCERRCLSSQVVGERSARRHNKQVQVRSGLQTELVLHAVKSCKIVSAQRLKKRQRLKRAN